MNIIASIIVLLFLHVTLVTCKPEKEIGTQKIEETFEKIRDKCQDKLKRVNDNVQKKREQKGERFEHMIQQIVGLSVLSAVEVDSSQDIAVSFYLNQNNDDKAAYYGEKIHGEIDIILRNEIYEKIDLHRRKSKVFGGKIPYVFIYSHYIPCTCNSNVGYFCAEELTKYARQHQNKFKMVVGYSDVYSTTDPCLAERYLHQSGGIFAVTDMRTKKTDFEIDSSFKRPRLELFQKLWLTCLMKADNFCGNDCRHCKTKKRKYVRDEVDSLLYDCTKRSSSTGYLTQLGLNELRGCFEAIGWESCCDTPDQKEKDSMRDCFDSIDVDPTRLLHLGRAHIGRWIPPIGVDYIWREKYYSYQRPRLRCPSQPKGRSRERVVSVRWRKVNTQQESRSKARLKVGV